MTQKTPAEIEIENFKGCEKEDTPRIEKTEQEKFKENNQHKINNDEGDSCLSASTDRKSEEMSRNGRETFGFSTPNEEIIEKIKEYLALERWGKGQNNDRLIELFEKALSLQRQENEEEIDYKKCWNITCKEAKEWANKYKKLEQQLSNQKKEIIEKIENRLKVINREINYSSEVLSLSAVAHYQLVRNKIEEISKIFKEMGQ